jgi:hypothetical protein
MKLIHQCVMRWTRWAAPVTARWAAEALARSQRGAGATLSDVTGDAMSPSQRISRGAWTPPTVRTLYSWGKRSPCCSGVLFVAG